MSRAARRKAQPLDVPARVAASRAARDRRTNLGIGAILLLVVMSGLTSNTFGTPTLGRWVVIGHGATAAGLLVLARRKARIVGRSLGRPRRRPGTAQSLLLAILVLTTLATGLLHTTGLTDRIGPLTLMQVHIGAAVGAVPLAVAHYRRRPYRRRTPAAPPPAAPPLVVPPPDPTRRALLLHGAAVSGAAGALWAGWETGLLATGAPGAARRFTGSHERGSGDPTAFPVTQWLDDRVQRLDPAAWVLDVAGARVSLADLRDLPMEDVVATLDCTSLWWSEQSWRGVRLDRLVDPRGARSVRVRSATGYSRVFPARDLPRMWLALGCGGRPLSSGHGFPARIVAPGRRGFWWVKWVDGIEPTSTPWWLQPPYPLT